MQTLHEKIHALPPDLQREVEDFVEFLLERRVRKIARPLDLSWRGALSDLRDQYTSVELQHKVSDWIVEGQEKKLEQQDDNVSA